MLSFAEEEIVFDMYAFNLNRSDESMFKDGYQMLNVIQLQSKIDSLKLLSETKKQNVQSYFNTYFKLNDSTFGKYAARELDSTKTDLLSFVSGSKQAIIGNALNTARTVKSVVDYTSTDVYDVNKLAIRYTIEWHKKYTLAVACFIMFFIGAPLGSIIRKGGFGTPVVVSILLYIVFHIISITGEKMAKSFTATPASGMWLSIMVLLPLGLFFTYQAANDSGLFDKSAYVKQFNKLKRKFTKGV